MRNYFPVHSTLETSVGGSNGSLRIFEVENSMRIRDTMEARIDRFIHALYQK